MSSGYRSASAAGKAAVLFAVTAFLIGAYTSVSQGAAPASGRCRVFALKHISAHQAGKYLEELDIGTVSILPTPNTILVTATQARLLKAANILKVADSERSYVIHRIGQPDDSERVPTAAQISEILGEDYEIGDFKSPPVDTDKELRVLFGVHDGVYTVVAPLEAVEKIIRFVEAPPEEQAGEEPESSKNDDPLFGKLLGSIEKEEEAALEARIKTIKQQARDISLNDDQQQESAQDKAVLEPEEVCRDRF